MGTVVVGGGAVGAVPHGTWSVRCNGKEKVGIGVGCWKVLR